MHYMHINVCVLLKLLHMVAKLTRAVALLMLLW